MSRAVADLETRLRTSLVFRPTDTEADRPHSVYRCFDATGALLYVGCARDIESRIYLHLATFQAAASIEMHGRHDHHTAALFPTRAAARVEERRAIHDEAPLFNRQHNPKRWRRVDGQYVPAKAPA